MITVVTDSSSDIPVDLAGHYGIEVVPITIRFGDREYLDGVDLSNREFWDEIRQSDVLPETGAPGVGQFEDAYLRAAQAGSEGIVAATLSAKLGATYESARLAAERVRDHIPVEVVDSETVSMALGFQVLEAARAAYEGRSLTQVVEAAVDARPGSKVVAALETLEYLRRGGRLGTAEALVGGLLAVKPLISLEGGVVTPIGKVRTRDRALDVLADRVGQLAGDLAEVAVVHAQADDLEGLLIRLERHLVREDLIIANIGPVVGTHTGPGAIGVAYRLK